MNKFIKLTSIDNELSSVPVYEIVNLDNITSLALYSQDEEITYVLYLPGIRSIWLNKEQGETIEKYLEGVSHDR